MDNKGLNIRQAYAKASADAERAIGKTCAGCPVNLEAVAKERAALEELKAAVADMEILVAAAEESFK